MSIYHKYNFYDVFQLPEDPLIPAQASQARWMRVRIHCYWVSLFTSFTAYIIGKSIFFINRLELCRVEITIYHENLIRPYSG
jgi:hypothetical protein